MYRTCLCLVLMLLFAAAHSDAAVHERDWKTPGDGLLTLDTVNQREWLDLSEALLVQFPGATIEDRYQSVVGELAAGGMFEGFLVAKSADVIALAQSAGIDTTTQNYATNSSPTTFLGQLLGFTVPSSLISVGLIDEFQSPQHSVPLSAVFWTLSNQAGLVFGEAHAQFGAPPGVMLYRAIPEPSVSTLIVWGILSFNLCWRHLARRC